MNIEEFRVATKEELIEYGKTIPLDAVYASNGNRLSYRSITGYWYEKTYDSNNNVLTHKDAKGDYFELLCVGKQYNLMYDKNLQLYKAGCQELSYKNCIQFFNEENKSYIDVELFMNAIHQNELDILK